MRKIYENILYAIVLMLFSAGAIAAADIPRYNLKVKLDPDKGLLEGWADIDVPSGISITLAGELLNVKELKIDGKVISPDTKRNPGSAAFPGPASPVLGLVAEDRSLKVV